MRHKGPQGWSKAAWLAQIAKLNIQRGDILLVRNVDVMEQLVKAPSMGFSVPLIYDPSNSGISKLKRQDLLDALDQLDALDEKQAQTS